jgi:hypothetical protein
MKNADKFFNYINTKNNAKIAFYTSQSNICYCSNILTDNIKVIIKYIIIFYIYIEYLAISTRFSPSNNNRCFSIKYIS